MPLPTFSIVIPTYARPKELATCLASMSRLDYPRDRFEVIVVDDGSPQSPDGIVAPFEKQLDVRLVRQSNAGPAMARNTGVSAAKYDFIAFTDDDCTPRSNWLTALATQFDKT
ncbi:MAG TPA: glycosyltransferase, partial [Tepidisphaeraceae bacterium]|nr:glycosyltransferase [Tepidisphaeraceae bacterium]